MRITNLSVEIGGDNTGVVYFLRSGRCTAYAVTSASLERVVNAVKNGPFIVHPSRTGWYAERERP